MKTIEDAVIELGGKWPSTDCKFMHEFLSKSVYGCNNYGDAAICTKEQFESCAKRLGFIYGYRWGVEYPTNGKRPDLAEWMIVEIKKCEQVISGHIETLIKQGLFDDCTHFKITDLRYKPSDTSYLNAVSEKPEIKQNDPDVSDLIIALSDASNLAVDLGLTDCARDIMEVCKNIQAKSHREKVIEAAALAVEMKHGSAGLAYKNYCATLYDAGMLVLPQDSGNTKD